MGGFVVRDGAFIIMIILHMSRLKCVVVNQPMVSRIRQQHHVDALVSAKPRVWTRLPAENGQRAGVASALLPAFSLLRSNPNPWLPKNPRNQQQVFHDLCLK